MILPTHRTVACTKAVRRTAFTLLEVLVVVAIIVMLAGVGGYYVVQQFEGSKVNRAKIDATTLSNLVETYYVNNGNYPASLQDLAVQQPNGDPALCGADKLLDPWNQQFQIDTTGTNNNGLKPDIFTVHPKTQKRIGNWRDQ